MIKVKTEQKQTCGYKEQRSVFQRRRQLEDGEIGRRGQLYGDGQQPNA